MTDENATPIATLVAEAWDAASKRYVRIWGTPHSKVCMVFDRVTETVVFRAEPPDNVIIGDAVTSKRCEWFIDKRCAEAVLDALRDAGYLR